MLLPLPEATLESCGGKAASLRLLRQRGLPVPETRILSFDVYRRALTTLPSGAERWTLPRAEELSRPIRDRLQRWRPDEELRRELAGVAEELGWPLVVRSSASCESLGSSAAPGVFQSVLGVSDLAALVQAIGCCWASLWEPPAWAVLHPAGRWPGGESMGVVLQPEIPARWAGLVLSRDPSDEHAVRVEAVRARGRELAEGSRDPVVLLLRRSSPAEREPRHGSPLPPSAAELLRSTALELERDLGGQVELEWVWDGAQLWLLQARPTSVRTFPRSFPLVWHRSEEEQAAWRWDREHNPEPLSPAHAGLIRALEERWAGAPRLMVQNGYLYVAESPASSENGAEENEPLELLWAELEQHLASQSRAAQEAPSAEAGLESALHFFISFYELYEGRLASARRATLDRFLRFAKDNVPSAAMDEVLLAAASPHQMLTRTEELSRLAEEIREDDALRRSLERPGLEISSLPSPSFAQHLKEHLARYGTLTETWDVASPTLAEEPHRLLPLLLSLASHAEEHGGLRPWREAERSAAELRAQLPPRAREELGPLLKGARLARRLEEEDDLLFSRALWVVRRALLQAGGELTSRGQLNAAEDVFYLSLERIKAALLEDSPRQRLAEETQRQRALLEEQRRLVPPLTIEGRRLTWPAPPSGIAVLRGIGVGGVVRARVELVGRLTDLLSAHVRGAAVVCSTLLPALAVVLPEAAALITDHGGLLSHAACLAREMGVPAVVGTGTATLELRQGEQVWVDGSRGLVVREG